MIVQNAIVSDSAMTKDLPPLDLAKLLEICVDQLNDAIVITDSGLS